MSTAVGTRDVQKAAVYEAEQLVRRLMDRSAQFPTLQVAGSTITLPAEKKFGSVESVQTYVDAVLALNWVRTTWPRAARPVRVRERAGDTKAHYHRGVIAVPAHTIGSNWALRELVVLHELAHHLDTDAQPHGPSFVGIFLQLVTEIIGPEAGLLLRITLHEQGATIG